MRPDPGGRIIVVGGGPAGGACAIGLARLGHQVVLIDRGGGHRPRLGETCGAEVGRALEALCGGEIPPAAVRSVVGFASAWGSDQTTVRNLTFWQAGAGLALDRAMIDDWLLRSAETLGVQVVRGGRLIGADPVGPGWLVRAASPLGEQTIPARFCVEATGRASRSVFHPDVGRFIADDLVCLSVILPDEGRDDSDALVESCSGGWWFSALFPGRRRLIALFTDADQVGPPQARAREFRAGIEATRHLRRFGERIGPEPEVRVRDARTSARRVLWRGSWLVIGDAAWCLDPLSGNGIGRAIRDGIDAAKAIATSLVDSDPSSLQAHAVGRAESFLEHLATQRAYYQVEHRWVDSSFWRRRR